MDTREQLGGYEAIADATQAAPEVERAIVANQEREAALRREADALRETTARLARHLPHLVALSDRARGDGALSERHARALRLAAAYE